MNIVLTGFMGTGKSRIGQRLAKKLRMSYVDTDELIEKREKESIPAIFKKKGEEYFRQLETQVAKEVVLLDNYVISTGGGIVLRKENIEALRKNALIVCLFASPEVIFKRTKENEDRPLLEVNDRKKRIEELLRMRKPFYKKADLKVDTSKLSGEEVVEEIVKFLGKRKFLEESNGYKMRIVDINLEGERSYPVYIGADISDLGKTAKGLPLGDQILIVSDDRIYNLYGNTVKSSLEESNFNVSTVCVPEGEISKSLSQVEKLYALCAQLKLDRSATILGLGGGVIGDLAGFTASTYLRGVNFLLLPTTLLAQVDASIGGKVGVDLPAGKNLVGSFYQPKFVYMALETLRTLEPKQIKEGLAEVVKYGVIKDKELFCYLEKNVKKLKNLDKDTAQFIIERSVKIKRRVVEEDEREERGKRQVLNFGHTIGHAIEAATDYEEYTHGEAVSVGMVAAARISEKLDFIAKDLVERLRELLKTIGLPVKMEKVDEDKLWDVLYRDKKVRAGRLNFVLPKDLGDVFITSEVSPQVITEVIREMKR